MKCSLCPRKCNALRTETENPDGFCKMPLLPVVAKAALHYGEEPPISGKNGSGTIFFSGCSLSCVYCQNRKISREGFGKRITYSRLAEIFYELEKSGAHNINLVTPTHYALAVKQALQIYRPSIPVVYNCGGYETVETLKMLSGYVDIYLMDFKYFSSERAARYSAAPDYPKVVKQALLEAYFQKPHTVIENGIMQSGVIVRHLLLPRATREAIDIFDWVRTNLPEAYFSIMSQYLPMGPAINDSVINRTVTKREYNKVLDYIVSTGFQHCFFQDLSSADSLYIPDFNLHGV